MMTLKPALALVSIQVLEVAVDNPWLPPKNVFRAIDSDGDKQLTEDELAKYLKNEMVRRGEYVITITTITSTLSPSNDSLVLNNLRDIVNSIYVTSSIKTTTKAWSLI